MDAPLLTADFKEFLSVLNAHRVDYLLVGSYASGRPRLSSRHRRPRRLGARHAGECRACARGGARVRIRHACAEPRTVQRSPEHRWIQRTPFRIEVMTSIDGVEFEPCWARALSCDLDGVTVPVISLADLKVNKRAAGRHKDLADLDNLP